MRYINTESHRGRKLGMLIWTILITATAFGQDKSVSVETIEIAKRAIVPLVCLPVNAKVLPENPEIFGTSFFVNNEGYFVTAAHVVKDFEKRLSTDQPCDSVIYVPLSGWDKPLKEVRWFRFMSCLTNTGVDFAVCKPIDNPFRDQEVKGLFSTVTFKNFVGNKDGTQVAFTGFPLSFLRPVTSKGNIASYVEARQEFVIDKTAWPGASGSPVYLSDGSVIGIVRETGGGVGAGLTYARPAEWITAFLTANKIRFQEKEKQKAKGEGPKRQTRARRR